MNTQVRVYLLLIFLLGLLFRFLYFPSNVYFGYDQARDAFSSLEILSGHLKLVGPPSSFNESFFHSPLIYYIYAPLLFIFDKNPESIAIFVKILNTLGVVLVFFIGLSLFNKKVGLISALFFAVSFEQSQYSLFIGHPGFAVLPVMLFYFGWILFVWNHKSYGLLLSFFSMGLAMQFHYIHGYLLIVALFFLFLYRANLSVTQVIKSICIFLFSLLPFILSEIKFGFRLTKAFTELLDLGSSSYNLYALERVVRENIFFDQKFLPALYILGLIFVFLGLRDKTLRGKVIFLAVWFLSGLVPYLVSGSTSYYFNAGTSAGLIIGAAAIIYFFLNEARILGSLFICAIIFSNIYLIINENFKGPNRDMVIQPQMFTNSEKQAVDYIYARAQGGPFAVNALTIPLSVNTTWCYIFEWYGGPRYGYLPVWGADSAQGFACHLKIEAARSVLPSNRFLIIEPTVGMGEADKQRFLREESYFSKVVEEKRFGTISVEHRKQI